MDLWEVRCDVNNYASVLIEGEYPVYEGTPVLTSPVMRGRFTESEPIGDFAYLTAGALVARRQVVEKFPSALRSEIQLIPVAISGGKDEYYVLNVTNVIDALDEEGSEIKYFPSSRRVYRVTRYVFRESLLNDACLFKVPQLVRTDIYATPRFREFVEKEKLSGLLFEKK